MDEKSMQAFMFLTATFLGITFLMRETNPSLDKGLVGCFSCFVSICPKDQRNSILILAVLDQVYFPSRFYLPRGRG